MDIEAATGKLTEQKVVRRGLLAGLAALGAAVAMKVTGTETAEAAPDFVLNTPANAATSETRLTASPGFSGPVLQVTNGSVLNTSNSVITAVNSFNSGAAIFGRAFFAGGTGVLGNVVSNQDGVGVQGNVFTAGSIGVAGVVGSSAAGVAVDGLVSATGGVGVRGRGQANGKGVFGFSSAGSTDNGDGSGIGVHGKSGSGPGVRGESASAAGVFGVSVTQPGVDGVSTNSLGVRGTSTNFVGLLGLSTNGHGLYGSTSGAGAVGVVAEHTAGGLGLLITGNAQIFGALQVFGVKNAVIKMQDGSNAAVYCQESPEPYFEDFGRAQLAGGVANVPLEREFATLVAGGDYMVFPAPQGDTKGLYVSRQDARGFEVREVQGGTGNVPFTYRIVTKRKDVEGRRFARVNTDAAQRVSGDRARLGLPNGQGPNTGSLPPVFVPPASPAPNQPIVPAEGPARPAPGLTVREAP